MEGGVLVESVHRLRLGEVSREVDSDLARAAAAACDAIEQRTSEEERRLAALARDAGIEVEIAPVPHARQNHAMTLRVADFADADSLADLVAGEGYERWERWAGGARESFRRTATMLTVARTDDVSMVVRVRWADPIRRNVVRRMFVPTSGDWHVVDLPVWAWPLYSLIRPVRHLAERLGVRRRDEASLGPFLTTPDSLLPALVDFAGVARSDRLVDLGCGDGRIVVSAAEQIGCRAVGVESDDALVRRATARSSASPASDLIEIVHGDARLVDLSEVTVVFVFLPVAVIGGLVTTLIAGLPAGARIVVHEQSELPGDIEPRPSRSELLVARDAVTVAHLWVAPGAPVS